MNLREQKNYLDKKWKIVPLRGRSKTEAQRNKRLIKTFSRPDSSLESYLKKDAWEDDESGSRKIFLILEKVENKNQNPQKRNTHPKFNLVGYFGLSCGVLFVPENGRDCLKDHEETLVKGWVNALELGGFYLMLYETLVCKLLSEEDLKRLFLIANRRFEAREDRKNANEASISDLVDDVYPAIEFTHICHNVNHQMPDGITIEFLPYIFWEKIVQMVTQISELAGAQYLYLFAAESNPDNPSNDILLDESAMKHGKGTGKKAKYAHINTTNKLIRRYMTQLKFRIPEDIHVLKPEYDYNCFTMVQEISQLSDNRIKFWESYSIE